MKSLDQLEKINESSPKEPLPDIFQKTKEERIENFRIDINPKLNLHVKDSESHAEDAEHRMITTEFSTNIDSSKLNNHEEKNIKSIYDSNMLSSNIEDSHTVAAKNLINEGENRDPYFKIELSENCVDYEIIENKKTTQNSEEHFDGRNLNTLQKDESECIGVPYNTLEETNADHVNIQLADQVMDALYNSAISQKDNIQSNLEFNFENVPLPPSKSPLQPRMTFGTDEFIEIEQGIFNKKDLKEREDESDLVDINEKKKVQNLEDEYKKFVEAPSKDVPIVEEESVMKINISQVNLSRKNSSNIVTEPEKPSSNYAFMATIVTATALSGYIFFKGIKAIFK